MFAKCARTEPATMSSSRLSFALLTLSALPSCLTEIPERIGRLIVPFAPLIVTVSAAMLAVTPCGKVTGCFATRDIFAISSCAPLLRHDANDFAAVSLSTCLAVAHHTLRRRDDGNTQPSENRRQLVFAFVNAEARTTHSIESVDHGFALEIAQLHRQRDLAVFGLRREILDITLVLQYLRQRQFHFGRR